MQDKKNVTLVIIQNPFEPWNGRRVEKIEAGESLQSLMERNGIPGLEMRATVNGESADPERITVAGDFVVVSPVIAKGGGGKGILGTRYFVTRKTLSNGGGGCL